MWQLCPCLQAPGRLPEVGLLKFSNGNQTSLNSLNTFPADISRDAWTLLYDFLVNYPTVENYRDDGAWPLIVDDFVAWVQDGKEG